MNGDVDQEHCVHVHLCITLSRFIVRDKIQSRWNVSWFSTLPRRSTLPPHRLRTCWTATLNAEGRPWATIICHRGNPYSTLTIRHDDPQNLFFEILVLCIKITKLDRRIFISEPATFLITVDTLIYRLIYIRRFHRVLLSFYLSKLYSFLLFYQIHRNINTSKKKSLYNNLYVMRIDTFEKNRYIYLEFQCLVSFS